MSTIRKETSNRIVKKDGTAVTVRLLDGIVVDDLLIQGMKAEGYRVMTGRDVFPTIGRNMRDYLIRLNVISE